MTKVSNSKILILSTSGFEHSELFEPRQAMIDAGATVKLVSPTLDPIKSWKDKDWGEEITPDMTIADVDAKDYDALILPGGQMNPDILRANPDAVALVKDFVLGNKIVAAICHAPWLLIEAGAVKGRTMTSYGSIKTDLINAGADWVDQDVAISNGIITSRSPEDLKAFNAKIIEEIKEGDHARAKLSKAA